MAATGPSRQRMRVALLVETSLASGREILRGIARLARETDAWHLFHAAGGLLDRTPDWLAGWEGDGVIARIQSPEMADALRRLALPVVDVLGVVPDAGFPVVHVDDAAIAALAAQHFRERDFRQFGFFGIAGENWSHRRRDGLVRACGGKVEVLELSRSAEAASEEAHESLGRWLRSLPKPIGILVASDQRGLMLLESCRAEGLAVPEQVAVVGVDNDPSLCEISSPPLSSVRAGHFRVGYEAARLLDRLMAGGAAAAAEPLLVPPSGVVGRGSSDSVAIGDPVVAAGLRFLREHLADPVTNEAVARAAGVSRTRFQGRFREALGQTVRQYLIEARLRRARSLLEHSDLTLAEIAARCGFRHQEYFGEVFRRQVGETPAVWRRRAGS